ncbi:MAG: accessory factor UbiK family protein [Flavobacteriaceae bacterium]
MTQTSNRLLDEMARLMTDAVGVARGVRGEIDTVMRGQAERILRDLDIVQRDEFEAVRLMAEKARGENEALKSRIEILEAALSRMGGKPAASPAPKAAARAPARTAPEAAAKPAAKRPAAAKASPAKKPRKD